MKLRTIKYTMPDGSTVEGKSRKILYKTFKKEFSPRLNHLKEPNTCQFNGCMYETFGEELNYIWELCKDPVEERRVWTVVEADNDKWYISAGYHHVNRIGFLVTEKAREAGIEYEDIFYM